MGANEGLRFAAGALGGGALPALQSLDVSAAAAPRPRSLNRPPSLPAPPRPSGLPPARRIARWTSPTKPTRRPRTAPIHRATPCPPPRSRTLPGRMRKSSWSYAMRRRLELEARPATEKMQSTQNSAETLAPAEARQCLAPHPSRPTALGALKRKRQLEKAPLAYLDGTSKTDQKQCADKALGTTFRQRGNSLYLAFLIGRTKSSHINPFFNSSK